MILNKSNCELINTKEIYMHDDIFVSLDFNYNEKTLIMHMIEYYGNKKAYVIKFCDVAGFEISSSDFWGAADRVCDYEYINSENSTLILKLQNEWLNTPNNDDRPLPFDEHFESLFTFISGDTLRIAAKTVEIIK